MRSTRANTPNKRTGKTTGKLAEMDSERWVEQRMDTLRMRNFLSNTDQKVPAKIERRMLSFDPDERNSRGETLLIAIIRYVTDMPKQRAGADLQLTESRYQRTGLMFACMERSEGAVTWFLSRDSQIDLTCQDKAGNTALMYAALYGHTNVVNMLVNELSRRWSFDIFRVRNCMGHTAESLARKNGRGECARLLRKERLQMLQRMHKQLALIHLSAKMKGWGKFSTVYKAKDLFQQQQSDKRVDEQRKSVPFREQKRTKSSRRLVSSRKSGPGYQGDETSASYVLPQPDRALPATDKHEYYINGSQLLPNQPPMSHSADNFYEEKAFRSNSISLQRLVRPRSLPDDVFRATFSFHSN